jgi:hypothetical protein
VKRGSGRAGASFFICRGALLHQKILPSGSLSRSHSPRKPPSGWPLFPGNHLSESTHLERKILHEASGMHCLTRNRTLRCIDRPSLKTFSRHGFPGPTVVDYPSSQGWRNADSCTQVDAVCTNNCAAGDAIACDLTASPICN